MEENAQQQQLTKEHHPISVPTPPPPLFPKPKPPDQSTTHSLSTSLVSSPTAVKLLRLNCRVPGSDTTVKALVDCGASTSFIAQQLVDSMKLQTRKIKQCTITLGNNSTCFANEIVDVPLHLTDFDMILHVSCLVLPLSTAVILGYDFLVRYNPCVDWEDYSIRFNSKCRRRIKRQHVNPERFGEQQNAHLQLHSFVMLQQSPTNPQTAALSSLTHSTSLNPRPCRTHALPTTLPLPPQKQSATEPKTSFPDHSVTEHNELTSAQEEYSDLSTVDVSLNLLDARRMNKLLKNQSEEIETVHFCSLQQLIEHPSDSTAKQADDPLLNDLKLKYASVFSDQINFPPSRGIHDHSIELIDNAKPVSKPHYRLSTTELDELQRQLKDLLDKGFIKPSTSSWGAPVLFVKKKNGELRMCVDYRELNALTVKNKYPLPRIDELINRLHGTTYFSKIDLKSGYHQLQVQEADRHKTAFRTRYGSYEFQVMSFGLTNAPSSFMALMHDVLDGLVDKSVVVYLDDIIIFSKGDKFDHQRKLDEVLRRLEKHQLIVNQKKCEFFKTEVDFLGFHISRDGLSTEDVKIKAIRDLSPPSNLKQLRSFIGTMSFYRDFIPNFSSVCSPLSQLQQKDMKWNWGIEQQKAFEKMKELMITAPILMIPDDRKTFIVNTDASDIGVGAVLQQVDSTGNLRPCAYFSKKLLPAETRYPTHDQEMLALILALKHWRHFLYRSPFIIRTDHAALTHFHQQPHLNKRQLRWIETLADYNFTIEYQRGVTNVVADLLSRNPYYDDGSRLTLNNISTGSGIALLNEVREAGKRDKEYCELVTGELRKDGFTVRDNLVYYHQRLVIPDSAVEIQSKVLSECHETSLAGHYGIAKTTELLTRTMYWKNMNDSVKIFVQSCSQCQRNKASNQLPSGLLQPIPTPERRWDTVTIDFIGPLPLTKKGNNSIITIVDKTTKMVHFISTTTSATAPVVASLFIDNVVRLHGLPTTIISDRDVRFTAQFWKSLWSQLGTRLALSTSFHPETDGQSERANRTVEQYLRSFVNYHQNNWDTLLTSAEISYNNSVQLSTGFTPYFLNSGQHPRFPVTSAIIETSNESAEKMIEKLYITLDQCQANLAKAQQKQKKHADVHRSDVSFNINDKVLLRSDNLSHDSLISKLSPKYIGPFKIIEKINDVAYRLQLPDSMNRIHNSFHVSRLKKFNESNDVRFPSRLLPDASLPPPEIINQNHNELWEVETILKKRIRRYGRGSRVEYLIKWKGYPHEHNSWEPVSGLTMCKEAVEQFESSRD